MLMLKTSVILICASILTWIFRWSLGAYYGIKYKECPEILAKKHMVLTYTVLSAVVLMIMGFALFVVEK